MGSGRKETQKEAWPLWGPLRWLLSGESEQQATAPTLPPPQPALQGQPPLLETGAHTQGLHPHPLVLWEEMCVGLTPLQLGVTPSLSLPSSRS